MPKKPKYIASFLNEEQINELLIFFKDEPMYPVILLTAFYGGERRIRTNTSILINMD